MQAHQRHLTYATFTPEEMCISTDFSAQYEHKAAFTRTCEHPGRSNMDVFVVTPRESQPEPKRSRTSLQHLRSLLEQVPSKHAQKYKDWVTCGIVIHSESSGSDEGLQLWTEWSQRGSYAKSAEVDCRRKWASLQPRPKYRSARR